VNKPTETSNDTNGTVSEAQRVFALQSDYRWTAKNTSAAHRIALLEKLRAAVVSRAGEVRDALHADLGRPAEEPIMGEVADVLGDIDEAIAHLEEWMAPTPVEPTAGLGFDDAKVSIAYEARGVVLLFGPWNFPFQLVLSPLVPIIAAGNTAIVKPNEMTPATSALLASIIREVFDEREVAVFEGGVDLANELLDLPVDHIFFTGSPAVGKIVMAAAAKHLASVTLELGGKCPAIIDDTADLDLAVTSIAEGKLYNAGQVCLSPDYVLVTEANRDAFVERYLAWLEENLYVDGQFDAAAISKLVDDRNYARVAGYVGEAVQSGAVVRGPRGTETPDRSMEPVVLMDVPPSASVLQEEIFGPVLPVLTFIDAADVQGHVRTLGKPLAMYIFSADEAFVDEVVAGTSSGGVTVNGWASHFMEPRLPFGGIGSSGVGAYHGVFGFRELSHARGIVQVT
jgi:aldehyde dehydrogenase (NAD+)